MAAAARSDVTFNKSEAATAARAAEVPEKYWCNIFRKGTKLERVQCVVCSRNFPMRADGLPWFHYAMPYDPDYPVCAGAGAG